MPFQVSPGVNVSEIDLTTVIPAVSTSVGAFAGRFRWGPVETSTLISSEDELADQFGEPTTNTAVDFFTAANFLAYTSALRVVRAANNADGTLNAADTLANAKLIRSRDHFTNELSENPGASTFYAKYPGILGNQIIVEVCDTAGDSEPNASGFKAWWPNTYFDYAPGTSVYASDRGHSNDEMHVAIINHSVDGFDTANAVLELYPFLSKARDAKNEAGESIYFKEVLNNKSKYIWVGDPSTAVTNLTYGYAMGDYVGTGLAFGNAVSGFISRKLAGGVDVGSVGDGGTQGGGVALAAGDYQRAWDIFSDTDQEDVSLILAGTGGADLTDADQRTNIGYVVDIATTRKDAVTFYSPLKSDVVDASTDSAKLTNLTGTTGFRTGTSGRVNKNTSYAFLDSGWKYQYDKYNDVYRWVPLNGDVAGLAARTDQARDAWWSPAGYNRGQIKNVVKLAYNPSKAHRDNLYLKQINPVVSFPGQGTLLFGDKTSATRPSAFDRLNVRRLFIVLEKAISTAAKFSLFEFNDDFTRAQFRNMVEPFLRDVKGRRGINEFKVVCDETNNPGSVIDRNEFVGDIYIKPARSINFIQLNFVAVATGVDFSEVVGQF